MTPPPQPDLMPKSARVPDRRAVLGGLAALALPTAQAEAKAAAAPVSFLAVGDWGRDGSRDQTRVADAMAAAAHALDSRFVLAVGDNFYPGGVQSPDDAQWRTSFEDVYHQPALQTPWYAALGNHDYRGRPHAQVAYSQRSRRWRMPNRYYKVRGEELGARDLDLFVLDTTPIAMRMRERVTELAHGKVCLQDGDRQLAWFARELAASTARWKVVVGHHPIHSGGHHGDTPELVARLKPLLAAHGVTAYVCGHDHALQHIRRDGVDYVCTGAGASAGWVLPQAGMRFRGAHAGFAAFTLDAAGLALEFRNDANTPVYAARLGG
jgi:acid phosphatase